MEMEISCDELYALNNDLVFKFSEIMIENKIKINHEIHNIISQWHESYRMNMSSMNILNPVFIQFSDTIQVNSSSILQSFIDLGIVKI